MSEPAFQGDAFQSSSGGSFGKTFQQLKISLGDWLVVNDTPGQFGSIRLPESVRGDMINMAIRDLLRNYDTRYGEFSFSFNTEALTSIYNAFTAAPWFSRPRSLWYVNPDGECVTFLTFREKIRFDQEVRISGTLGTNQLGDPTIYTYWAGNFELGKVPNRIITIYGTCYRYLPDLSEADDLNGITAYAWEYVLFKALSMAEQFGIEDDRIPAWEARAENIAKQIAFEHMRSLESGKTHSQSQEPG